MRSVPFDLVIIYEDLDPEPMRTPGAPLMFMLRDPDGNHIVVVEAPTAE